MGWGRRSFGIVGAVALLSGSLFLSGDRATAAPPPPSFWEFTIVNHTGQDVEGLVVRLFAARPEDDFQQLELNVPAAELLLDVLPDGRSAKLSARRLWGVARILVKARCPNDLVQDLVLDAPTGDYDNDGVAEFMGFCPAPPNGAGNVVNPSLEFKPADPLIPGSLPSAEIRAVARWGGLYSPLMSQVQTFP